MPISVTTGGPINASAATASAISDYASLLIDAGEYSGRDDVAHLFSRFVSLAEAKINRVLRVGQMEASATIEIVDGNGDLPGDFLEARMVLGTAGQGLSAWSLQELQRRYGTTGGLSRGYSIVGGVIQARPTSSGNITLSYYARIPSLTPSSPTNWLLQQAPDAYLYAVVEEIGVWARDAELAVNARSMKEVALKELALQDEASRWGNGQVVIGGCTP